MAMLPQPDTERAVPGGGAVVSGVYGQFDCMSQIVTWTPREDSRQYGHPPTIRSEEHPIVRRANIAPIVNR